MKRPANEEQKRTNGPVLLREHTSFESSGKRPRMQPAPFDSSFDSSFDRPRAPTELDGVGTWLSEV